MPRFNCPDCPFNVTFEGGVEEEIEASQSLASHTCTPPPAPAPEPEPQAVRVPCAVCANPTHEDDMEEVCDELANERQVCTSCYENLTACDSCDCYIFDESNEHRVVNRYGNYDVVCPDCARDNYSETCVACGIGVHGVYATHYQLDTDSEDVMCPDCDTEAERQEATKRQQAIDNKIKGIMAGDKFKCEGKCGKERVAQTHGAVLSYDSKVRCLACFADINTQTGGSVGYAQRIFPTDERGTNQYVSQSIDLKILEDKTEAYTPIGMEVETEFGHWPRNLSIFNGRAQCIKTDGSCYGGWNIELLTMPSSGNEFVKTAETVFKTLADMGWVGSRRTGLHTHVQFKNPTPDEVRRLLLLTYIIEPFLGAKIPKARFEQSTYCRRLSTMFTLRELARLSGANSERLYFASKSSPVGVTIEQEIEERAKRVADMTDAQLAANKAVNGMKYTGINLSSAYSSRGTVEFRYPHCVINVKHALGFGLFFAGLVECARQANPMRLTDMVSAKAVNEGVKLADSVTLIKKIDTPSMRLLRSVNPEFLKV